VGEKIDPLTTDRNADSMSTRGIAGVMAAVAVAGALLGFVLQGKRFGVGILFGGVLAFINYFWLERSTRAVFENTAVSSSGWLAAKYILRYVAIGAVLLLIYLTGVLPVTAVIAGLAAFAVAVVIQGLKNIFQS
jgi:hypothetical protein